MPQRLAAPIPSRSAGFRDRFRRLHSEFWGLSDGLPLSVGHGAGLPAGPQRKGPNVTRRNSLALFNVVFRETLFWDGRSGKFRAPSLRNGAVTEPYFHNGSVPTLVDAVEHELVQSGLPFTDDDVRLIERFIRKGLRDESRAATRPTTVPSGLPVPVDGQLFPFL